MTKSTRRPWYVLPAAVGCLLLGLGPSLSAAGAGPATLPTYLRTVAGPAFSDMYPVDVTTVPGAYLVLDSGGYRIVKVDASSGAIVGQIGGHQGRAPGQLGADRALAVDSAGRIYVADTANNRVQVFNPDLSLAKVWGGVKGTGPGQFNQPYGIAVGPGKGANGQAAEVVYVTDQVFRVQKFSLDGTFIKQFGMGQLNQPRQLTVHPDTGDVYVVSARADQVVVFDKNGVKKFAFGGPGSGNGQFKADPRGIDIDTNGTATTADDLVFVTDSRNYRIQAFNLAGVYQFQFGNGQLNEPRGLSVAPGGKVVVTDEWAFAVKDFQINATRTGATLTRTLFGTPAPTPGFDSARGLDVDASGRLYALDWWNVRVERFSFNADNSVAGAIAWGFRGTTSEPGSINFAWDLAIQPGTGRVFVANQQANEVEVFDAAGNFVTRWGVGGSANGELKLPNGIAFAPDGTLVVADTGNNRIQRFTVDANGKGTWKATYGSAGSSPGQFKVPVGLSVAADGTIWVADTQNSRVQKRSPAGAWTAYAGTAGGTHAFKLPWGVKVAPDGSIWVADSGHDQIVKMTPTASLVFAFSGTDVGAGPFDSPFDVAFGPGGLVYVSDTWNNRVVQLQS